MKAELFGIVAVSLIGAAAFGQTIDPYYSGCYALRTIGTPTGVPENLGGINFLPGNPNVLLICGAANGGEGALYRITLVRDGAGAIRGFSGEATLVSTAPYNDGGLAVGPLGTLFLTAYPANELMQIPVGATSPASTISLDDLDVSSSVGTCQFVPSGFPGEGHLKILSYNVGTWYDFVVSNPSHGVFAVTRNSQNLIQLEGGPEGLVFIGAGNPGFPRASCLVSEYSSGQVASYEIDSNGDAIPSTRRLFISALDGAEGGVRDPLTGNFLFSTYGSGNQVVIVEGFNRDCKANYNADCAIDLFDYLDFLEAFVSGTDRGDFNNDGVVDLFDYLDFVQAFSNGC